MYFVILRLFSCPVGRDKPRGSPFQMVEESGTSYDLDFGLLRA